MISRGPPGTVCHNQKGNSFSQFARISSDFSHFCQLKGALQVQVQVEPKFFFSKMLQLTPPRCVKKSWDNWSCWPQRWWVTLSYKNAFHIFTKSNKASAFFCIWHVWKKGGPDLIFFVWGGTKVSETQNKHIFFSFAWDLLLKGGGNGIDGRDGHDGRAYMTWPRWLLSLYDVTGVMEIFFLQKMLK